MTPQRERSRNWYDANKELANKRSKAWHLEHRADILARRKAAFESLKADPIRYAKYVASERARGIRKRASMTPSQIERMKERNKAYRQRKPEAGRRSARRSHHKARTDCLNHYGNKCACCGEATKEFLAIDHIDGGGERHRRELNKKSLFFHLRAHGYPTGFQVLCHNCNQAKGYYGSCPHTLRRNDEGSIVEGNVK